MRKQKTTILRRLTVALVLLLAAGTMMAIVPDPKKKKRVTITTTTTQKSTTTTTKKTTPTTTTKKSGTTTQKSGGVVSKKSTTNNAQKSAEEQQRKAEQERAAREARQREEREAREREDREARERAAREENARKKNKEVETITVNGVSFHMKLVEGGTFMMGATSEQGSDAWDEERPVHQVTLSSYYIGETEVTQELWQAVMGRNPSKFKGSHRPVERVSWEDCQEFIRRLNQKTGRNFRLPTEAEWEYAARGGRKSNGYKYAGGSSISDVAWYDGNSNSQAHDVGQKRPNELGLYDMAGNVWEWCQDWYGSYSSSSQTNPTGASTGSLRVLRGGSRRSDAGYCRVSLRYDCYPSIRSVNLGLRLAL